MNRTIKLVGLGLGILLCIGAASALKARGQGTCAPDSNYRYPFKPTRALSYCNEYNKFSCCDSKDAKKIKATVHEIVEPDCQACHELIAALKCSECHPNSADFWVYEESEIKLCEEFCLALFAVCSDIPLYIDKKNKDGTSAAYYMNGDGLTAEEFCAPLIAPEPHCFEADIPDVWDDNCKCPEHDCHPVDEDPEIKMHHHLKFEL